MNEKQQALIKLIARQLGMRPEQVKPETKLGYASHDIATWFVAIHLISLQVADLENCTVGDLLEQLA